MLRRELLRAVIGFGVGAAGHVRIGSQVHGASNERAAQEFLAGAATIDITPEKPVCLGGYLEPAGRVSTGVHDRLFARAFAFGHGAGRMVLVSCDLGSLALGAYLRRTILDAVNLPPEQLLLCATHTHSGPLLTLHPAYPANVEYTDRLRGLLVTVVRQALRSLSPARLLLGRGTSAIGVNRRSFLPGGGVAMAPNPDCPADHDLLVLQLARRSGRPFAVLFVYACHARSLRAPNTLLSGDVFGVAAQEVEHSLDGVVAGAFAGASGDIDPVSVVDGFEASEGRLPETVRLAQVLAGDARQAMRAAREVSVTKLLRSASARVSLPRKHAGLPSPVDVTVARVGDLAFVGLDCEASVEIGLAIKAQSPCAATFVITNCNGWSGYLPVARQFAEGGYEVARTGFAPGAADRLVAETVKLLRQV